MLGGRSLITFGFVCVASGILRLFYNDRFVKRTEDRISALHDDLLINILLRLPTKEAVATMILSKRWRSVWTLLPQLSYVDSDYEERLGIKEGIFTKKKKSICWFLDESLKVHKAPVLESLEIKLGPTCPVDVDIGKWIADAVNRRVHYLSFMLNWLSEHTSLLPESLYICDTLVSLTISDKILVDVPSPACLPSLKTLRLCYVVYKDEDSLVRLLFGCPTLKNMQLLRHDRDNLTNIRVKVPCLETLIYFYVKLEAPNVGKKLDGSLVIDSASLKTIVLNDFSGNSNTLENEPRLDRALINTYCFMDDKFKRCLSRVMYLYIHLSIRTDVACYNAIQFSELIEFVLLPYPFDWLETLMCFLQNSPKLKVLVINQMFFNKDVASQEDFSFNRPSSVPGCLSTSLEIFEWKEYKGRNGEKQAVRYILDNSKCLKRAGFSIVPNCTPENRDKVMKELESMSRVSTSSKLLFSTQTASAPVQILDLFSD